jgi:hypothetical protein
MRLKDDSVKLEGVDWRMFHAALVAEAIYRKYGAEVVITSAKDGKHSAHSLHYKGRALDLRTWNLAGREMQVRDELQAALGDDYDVVLESDHIHMEHDPA